ncbi:MAG: 2-oxo acid dehydrogenase subunit E2, partial [Chitinophagaceae bacterium]
ASNGRFYSPLVLNIAAQEGIGMQELEGIAGTGNEGRVTKKDILQYVSDKKAGKVPAGSAGQGGQQSAPAQQKQDMVIPMNQVETSPAPAQYPGNVEIIEMDRMRKLIADHMVRSKHTSPHVTSFTEADVTNLVMWRDKAKKEFEKREGTKITFTPLFIEAIVRCIKKFPLINSSLDGTRIIVKKDINIGMATALPSGNLIVPVIKNADQLNLVGLAKQVNGMADAARNNKLKPEDISEGTFTLTNVGTFGSLMGTPIINQPQVAILAVGAIKKRPVVIETPHGDSIAIRHMMYLSLSYDHRIVDGSLGATFLTAVANELENFDLNRAI